VRDCDQVRPAVSRWKRLNDFMTTAIRRYLVRYILKRRAVALIGAITWAAAFVMGWLILCHTLHRWLPIHRWMFLASVAGVVAIVARPVMLLLRRYDPVAAAAEIESQHPEFDQRLITVASQPNDSAMLVQLVREVEAVTTRKKARVPLRPLLAPAMALLAAMLLGSAIHFN